MKEKVDRQQEGDRQRHQELAHIKHFTKKHNWRTFIKIFFFPNPNLH